MRPPARCQPSPKAEAQPGGLGQRVCVCDAVPVGGAGALMGNAGVGFIPHPCAAKPRAQHDLAARVGTIEQKNQSRERGAAELVLRKHFL